MDAMDIILVIGLILIFFGLIYILLKGMGKISDNDADIQIMGSRLKGSPGMIVIVLGVLLVSSFIIYPPDPENLTPKIIWSSPANITNGTALDSTQLNAVAIDPKTGMNVPGIFSYTPPEGTILDIGTHKLHVDFAPEDSNNYTEVSKDNTIYVVTNDSEVTKSIIKTLAATDSALTSAVFGGKQNVYYIGSNYHGSVPKVL